MTVVQDYRGRIKVELNNNDIEELQIDIDKIDCSNYSTRLLLRAIFKAATERIGLDLSSKRLLIEAYPNLHGGGILYFTPLKSDEVKRLHAVKKEQFCILDFSDGTALLNAIETLRPCTSLLNEKSSIYDIDGIFRLIINYDNDSREYIERAKEFSDEVYCDKAIKKYTCEHGKMLAGEYAINEILGVL